MHTLMEAHLNTSPSGRPESGVTYVEPPSVSATSVAEAPKTLLVVDDDPAVRDLEAQILRLHGYTVLEADSAVEAMRVAASTWAIHLLITDFAMPEVDGLELTRRFRAAYPSIPVLMVSGSLPLLRERTDPDLDHVELLAKPFLFKELLQKVRALLDATRPVPSPIRSRSD
jgi:CheY-like chemotaxis protein